MQIWLLIIAVIFWAASMAVFFFVYENLAFKKKRESWEKLLKQAEQKAENIVKEARQEAENILQKAEKTEERILEREEKIQEKCIQPIEENIIWIEKDLCSILI